MSRGQEDLEKPVGREGRQSGLLSDWWGIITSQVLPQNTPQTIHSRTQQLQNNIIAIRNHYLLAIHNPHFVVLRSPSLLSPYPRTHVTQSGPSHNLRDASPPFPLNGLSCSFIGRYEFVCIIPYRLIWFSVTATPWPGSPRPPVPADEARPQRSLSNNARNWFGRLRW